MKRYKKYKDSGVQWIGEIPEEWEKNKISRVFRTIGSGGTPDSNNELYYNGNISWLNTGDLNDDTIKYTNRKINDLAIKKFSTLKLYPKNSLVIAMYGATIGKLGITDIETTTNQACCVLANPIDMSIKYMYYWFLAGREYIINLSQGGGQPNISQQIIKDLYFFKPSINEQTQIAAYLDHKTSQLETIISKKEELIETLNASRTKIISETVTKGLDKNVEMKDSGVEWIGEIPKEWKVKKFKHIGESIIGLTYSPDDIKDEGTLVLRSTNIQNGKIDLASRVNVSKKIPNKLITRENDVLICARNGSKSLIGKCGYIDTLSKGITFGAFTLVFRCKLGKFIYYVLNADIFKSQLSNVFTTTINQLTVNNFNNMFLIVPSEDEIKGIATYLDYKTSQIDNLISKIEKQITLLKKAKEKLITEVVTGKINVTDL